MDKNLKQKLEAMKVSVSNEDFQAVRGRLAVWKDYHDGLSKDYPTSKPTFSEKVADEIYQARKIFFMYSDPSKGLEDLVPNEFISLFLARAMKEESKKTKRREKTL